MFKPNIGLSKKSFPFLWQLLPLLIPANSRANAPFVLSPVSRAASLQHKRRENNSDPFFTHHLQHSACYCPGRLLLLLLRVSPADDIPMFPFKTLASFLAVETHKKKIVDTR